MKGQTKQQSPTGKVGEPLSIRALARKLKADKATIQRAVDGVAPAAVVNGYPVWTVAQVKMAMLNKDRATPISADGMAMKDRKLAEQVRALKLASDLKEGLLVPRSKVAAAMAGACSDFTAQRVQVEQQMPAVLAGKEVDACREEVRRLMDRVAGILAGMAKHFTI